MTVALDPALEAELNRTLKSDDGTLLPRTERLTTGDAQLLEDLPRLDRDSIGRDLLLGDTIGRGGMGLVRVAEQRAIGRRVAVKQLDPAHRGDGALAMALLREAWVTGEIEHPNVIPIHGIGVDEAGGPMIVMKRVEGTSWGEILRTSERPMRWHLGVLLQVASAAAFAASRGILHRDLKPDNVMIGSFGEVYVLDWGIAVSLTHDRGGRVLLARDVSGVCGTPGYLAPEMVMATGERLGPWTDVYLLGAILHELITKERRHSGDNLHAMLLVALESKPYSYPAHVPPELAAIANRATAREPEARYPSANDFKAAIEEFLEHESSRELVDQAELRLASWSKLGPTPDAVAVQRYFGEARFALQQAIRAWPGNTRARALLDEAFERKFTSDLMRDDFEAASVVLEEIGEGSAKLRPRLEELRARLEQRRRELTELRALQNARNLDVGRRTRAFLALLFGLGFGATPIIGHRLGYAGMEGYPFFYAAGALKMVCAALLTWWAWETLSKTAVNKQVAAAVQLMLGCELAIDAFTQALGRTVENALLTNFGVYFMVTATLAITVDPKLFVSASLYIVGAFVAHSMLDEVHLVLGVTHLVAALVVMYVWRPATWLREDLEKRWTIFRGVK